ncbi:protein PBDC1 [Denticeps clupeoides]|uniref:protein PBDC1 n=1 Tax=Denticeps clupeoides TaxID=299321 RepID=UPI0010A37493|nr:protein PBDC1 [Denticeps clupeoides]
MTSHARFTWIGMASDNGLSSLGVEGAAAAAHALSLPAEAYGNDPQLEVMWAMKAYNHAEVYFNLISSVDPKFLKLTKSDDNIYSAFIETFSDLDLQMLDPDKLKSSDAKEKWRPFCNQFEGIVEDFNYGTLLRLDSRKDYTEENTIFATRIQFFAIEIARNRQGHNDSIFQAGCKAKQSKGKGQS